MSATDNNRIAKNTMYLYLRMGFAMLVNVFTARIVLQQLGVDDYGIYGVIGGMVTLFAVIQNTMAGATQRFLIVELGKKDLEKMNHTFNTSMQIHLMVIPLFLAIIEPAGLWFMAHKMIIPPERMAAAQVVFQTSIASTILLFLTVPFMAVVIAYERMGTYAMICILDLTLKLGVAISLMFSPADKLEFYSYLIMLSHALVLVIYWLYCKRQFSVITLHRRFHRDIFTGMLSFSGWSLWGSLSSVLANQGVNVLLNVFFGPVVNAARNISINVQNLMTQFSSSFQMAVSPQITKNCATGEIQAMNTLVIRSVKITLYLLLVPAVPLLVKMPQFLHLWLGSYPDYTVIFSQLILISSIVEALGRPIITAVNATGKIRTYQLIVGGILLMILPLSYLWLTLGGNPVSVFWANLAMVVAAMLARLILARQLIQISIRRFSLEIFLRGSIVTAVAVIPSLLLARALPDNHLYSLIELPIILIFTAIVSYFLGLNRQEQSFVKLALQKLTHKLHSK